MFDPFFLPGERMRREGRAESKRKKRMRNLKENSNNFASGLNAKAAAGEQHQSERTDAAKCYLKFPTE
jgi:hypothetical protein